MKVSSFKAMWLNAKPPPIPINNSPHQIEGMTPSIWHTQYKRKAIIPMTLLSLLCNRVDKTITKYLNAIDQLYLRNVPTVKQSAQCIILNQEMVSRHTHQAPELFNNHEDD